jgi:hypothetical protein
MGAHQRLAAAALCAVRGSSCMFARRRIPGNENTTVGYARASLSVQNRMVYSTASPKAVPKTTVAK